MCIYLFVFKNLKHVKVYFISEKYVPTILSFKVKTCGALFTKSRFEKENSFNHCFPRDRMLLFPLQYKVRATL